MNKEQTLLIPENYLGREQSYVKHIFLENYIGRVAYNILSFSDDFVFIDGFSGPWKSNDEALKDTSFGRATSRLQMVHRDHQKRNKFRKIRCLFIEEKKSRFINLESAVENIKHIEAKALRGTFEDKVDDIINYIGKSFSLTFIDPTGWTGFGLKSIKPILKLRGEVIINFMFEYITRFMEDPRPETAKTFNPLFGDDTWYAEFKTNLESGLSREEAVLQVYLRRLKETGNFAYVTSTRIKHPTKDRTYFYLVYATRNSKGVFEFRSVEKKAANIQEQVRDAAKQSKSIKKRSGQSGMDDMFGVTEQTGSSFDFASEKARRVLQAKSILYELLNSRSTIPIEEIQGTVLEVPLVWPGELNDWLLKLRRSGSVSIPGMSDNAKIPNRKSTLYVHNEISLNEF